MAFKKKNDLKKKAKKKAKLRNKENKQDGWDHEGGVNIENSDDKNEIKKKRYQSQENDEKMRRSRLKTHHFKLQRDFVKKMSNKVKFSDILGSYKNDDEDSEEDQGAKKRQKIEPPAPNTVPVFDRLNKMLNKNENDDSEEDSEEEKNSEDELLENGEEIEGDGNSDEESDDDFKPVFANQNDLHQNKEEMTKEVDDDDNVDSDNEDTKKDSLSFFDNFFVKSNHTKIGEGEEKPKKTKKIKEVLNGVTKNHDLLYSTLDQSTTVAKHFSEKDFSIKTLSELAEVNRLWKNNNNQLNCFASSILPCLSSYSDVFIEGMDYKNEAVITETCMMHLLFHLVKSR